jgi:hypothetical protein
MYFYVIVEGKAHAVEIPQEMLDDGEDFFARMDQDMDGGWQMGREWVENPDPLSRCQIAADRLLNAHAGGNETLTQLLAAYMVTRVPGTAAVDVDTSGEMFGTRLIPEQEWRAQSKVLSEQDARQQAEKEVAKVYKSGKTWRYAVLDPVSRSWEESSAIASEEEAQRLREGAVNERAVALTGSAVWYGQ